MNGVKNYVKYSVNECINNLREKLFICEGATYIYEVGRLKRWGRPDVPNVLNVPGRPAKVSGSNVPRHTCPV